MKHLAHLLFAALISLLAACGGGSTAVTGTISGFKTGTLVLTDGTDTLTIAAGSTAFTFPTLTSGTAYAVSVVTQPAGLLCTVANGSGTIDTASTSSDVVVTCKAAYLVSGSVTGQKSGLVLTNTVNGIAGDKITIAPGDISFAFPTELLTGDTYAISASDPNCTITGGSNRDGSGTVASTAVANLKVTCN